ncbi:muscle M-line assembly protein unc-89-like [Ptychodera flava]|uniref:muscle M-line assembly protein unc-89-like n=1 Tax=Ptychodera flava TaxID=63121 RepID=UPI003969FCD3
MATDCSPKVKRTRCKDLYHPSSSDTESQDLEGDERVSPDKIEQAVKSSEKTAVTRQSPVQSGEYRHLGIDNNNKSKFLDSLHIDTEVTRTRCKTLLPGRQCFSESKISAYLKKSKDIAVSENRKRKLGFFEVDSCIGNTDTKKRKFEQSVKQEGNVCVSPKFPRSITHLNNRHKTDTFAELSAEEYKFRHHIGERNAVDRVVTYNENTIMNKPKRQYQHVDSYPWNREENNNTVKRSPSTSPDVKIEDIKIHEEKNDSGCQLSDQDDKMNVSALNVKQEDEWKEEHFEEKSLIKEEPNEIISDIEDDVFTGTKNMDTEVTAPLLNTKAKRKKAKSASEFLPVPRSRRIASLTAQTKMQLLYEKETIKPPKKKLNRDESSKNTKQEKTVQVSKEGESSETVKKKIKHVAEVKGEVKKAKKSDKSKNKTTAISVSTVYGNTIHVSPVTKISLPHSPALWQQPLNLTKMYAQPQFIRLPNAAVLADQGPIRGTTLAATALPGVGTSSSVLESKRKAQKTAREKWKKKLANPTQGIRNSSRAASLNAQAVLANTSPKKRSRSDPGEYKPKKRKQTLSTGGSWVVAGLGTQYFIPNTSPVIINQQALPTHTAPTTLTSKKKKMKSQTPLEGLGQQLLASAAGPNVLIPSIDGNGLESGTVPQTITIGGLGSLTTPTYMPVQFTQSIDGSTYQVPQIGQAHFAQGFYQAGPILPTATLPDSCVQSKPVKNSQKTGKSPGMLYKPSVTIGPKLKLPKKKTTNGWRGQGEPFESAVFLQNDAPTVMRTCYNSIKRRGNEIINVRDCILLKSGPRKIDLPYVAKVASIWEDPVEGELMVSLLWYYRPEHIEGGRRPSHHQAELFACKHKDYNSVATIEDRCYVLTLAEYHRHIRKVKMVDEGVKPGIPVVPVSEEYPRQDKLPDPSVDGEIIFFCRRVYDYRQKRILKNPT